MKRVRLFRQFLFLFFVSFSYQLDAHLKIGVVSSTEFCGDREVAWRIKLAGEYLGWTVIVDEEKGRLLRRVPDLDFVICLIPESPYFVNACPNYLTVFHPFNYLDRRRRIKPFYEKYAGYLFTIDNIYATISQFKKKRRPLHHIRFYPTIHPIPYKRLELKELVTMVPVWGNRLHQEKFRSLFFLLSQSGRVKFYGVDRNEDLLPEGYIGKIPFDGVSVIGKLQQHGIVLILHSDVHNQEGIPSARIFEAAAASTVIISDLNPFVLSHFGDSVFYIDTGRSAEAIYTQIQEYLDEIEANPGKALQMAKKAHTIFTERFMMTDQLKSVQAMHRKIIQLQGK